MSIEQKLDTRRQPLTERVKASHSKTNPFNNSLVNSVKLSESTNFGHMNQLHGLSKSEVLQSGTTQSFFNGSTVSSVSNHSRQDSHVQVRPSHADSHLQLKSKSVRGANMFSFHDEFAQQPPE